ncbi:MAG TPA: carbohydrate ABC transporter permease [Symbiobacteriaceae bacterium]|jgi:multiple sugar transport system permease protein
MKPIAGFTLWKRTRGGLTHLLLLGGSVIMLLPLYWMLVTSLKTYHETIINPPTWIPKVLQWHNYLDAWHAQPYMGRYFYNSFYTSIITVIIEVIFSVLAAYAFARMTFIGKNILFVLFLSTMMIPGEVLLVPNFITIAKLHWMDSYKALIIPWTISVFAIFLLRQHFLQIPWELQEAAYLDGAGHTRFLFQIMIPLSRPPIATVALLKFIGSWNAFLWPLLVTNTPKMRTVSIGLMSLMQDEGPQYHIWMAAATLALLPVLLLFLAAQEQLVESVAKSGLKG